MSERSSALARGAAVMKKAVEAPGGATNQGELAGSVGIARGSSVCGLTCGVGITTVGALWLWAVMSGTLASFCG
jgi:hypothetical protein